MELTDQDSMKGSHKSRGLSKELRLVLDRGGSDSHPIGKD